MNKGDHILEMPRIGLLCDYYEIILKIKDAL